VACERITITNLIPAMLHLMLASPRAADTDTSSLRLVLSGGAPIAPEVVRRILETFGCDYAQTYGMTETSPYLTLSLLDAAERTLPSDARLARRARTGRPFGAIALRVMRLDGSGPVRADDQEVGEIWVRGETVTPGYWRRPDETRAAFTGDWLRTGDLAVVDATGSVNIVDRLKDMIVTGGENVYSVEVENVLFGHPAVLEAAVISQPDAVWGEVVHAAVVPRPGTRLVADELQAFCRERLAAFKVPRQITCLDALPRTGSGKVSKRVLRERLAGGGA
jgi:acyl-CoA synthetase (AMP-forming)/AMP-acid ligase II